MVTAGVVSVPLDGRVREFLRKHGAQSAFERFCGLIRDCFPECQDMAFSLQDDPDGEERTLCVVDLKVPALASEEERLRRWRQYHGRLAQELPFNERQLFGTIIRYLAE